MNSTAQRIDEAIDFLKDSTHQLKDGRMVALDDFQQKVRAICDEVVQVTPENKDMFAAKLSILADYLRVFEIDLRARQAEVNFELMSLNAKQKSHEIIH